MSKERPILSVPWVGALRHGREQGMSRDDDATHEQANAFAVALLCPLKWLRDDVEKMGGINLLDDAALRKLRRRYQVPWWVIVTQLEKLREEQP